MASQKREEEEIGEVMDAINTILIMMVRLSKGAIAAAMQQVEEEEGK